MERARLTPGRWAVYAWYKDAEGYAAFERGLGKDEALAAASRHVDRARSVFIQEEFPGAGHQVVKELM